MNAGPVSRDVVRKLQFRPPTRAKLARIRGGRHASNHTRACHPAAGSIARGSQPALAQEVCAIGYRNALDIAAQYSQSSEASLLYDTYCSESGTRNSRSLGASGDVVARQVRAIFSYSSNSNEETVANFCRDFRQQRTQQSRAASLNIRPVVEAMATMNQCMQIATSGAFIWHKVHNAEVLDISVTAPRDLTLAIRGVDPGKNTECRVNPGGSAADQPTSGAGKILGIGDEFSVSGQQTIFCRRKPARNEPGSAAFDESVVTVNANIPNGTYSVFWPSDRMFPPRYRI